MEKAIEKYLECPDVANITELRNFVKEISKLISEYEQSSYYEYDEVKKSKASEFRKKLGEIVEFYKTKGICNVDEETLIEKNSDGIEILKSLTQQIQLAEKNKKILKDGTLKLKGLNYTSNEISEGISSASKKIQAIRQNTENEIKSIKRVFYFFLIVIFVIIFDKIFLKFRKTSLMKRLPEYTRRDEL